MVMSSTESSKVVPSRPPGLYQLRTEGGWLQPMQKLIPILQLHTLTISESNHQGVANACKSHKTLGWYQVIMGHGCVFQIQESPGPGWVDWSSCLTVWGALRGSVETDLSPSGLRMRMLRVPSDADSADARRWASATSLGLARDSPE